MIDHWFVARIVVSIEAGFLAILMPELKIGMDRSKAVEFFRWCLSVLVKLNLLVLLYTSVGFY